MKHLFTFFFRLFFAFLAAKFMTRFLGLESMASLLGLTFLFLGNIYLFDYMDYRSQSPWRRRRSGRQPEPPPPVQPSATEPPSQT